MLEKTTDFTLAYDKLRKEIEYAPVPREILPTEEGVNLAMKRGDVFLHSVTDNDRVDGRGGAIAWISAEPSWEDLKELWVPHVWGESARHLQIIIVVCAWCVSEGYGDIPIGYRRTSHPITVLADQFASVTFSEEGRVAMTTPRTALASLRKAAR